MKAPKVITIDEQTLDSVTLALFTLLPHWMHSESLQRWLENWRSSRNPLIVESIGYQRYLINILLYASNPLLFPKVLK